MCMRAFEIGDGTKWTYLKLAERLQKHKIKHICTDGNKTYGFYKLSDKHHITKKETCLAESWNSKLRYYIPALVRKTKCYFKSIETMKMAMDFFMLVHNKF